MFKIIFKFTGGLPMQNSIWRNPKRMKEAARLNAKPFIEYSDIIPLNASKSKSKK